MTLRDNLLPVLSQIRSIPGILGLRVHTVEVALTTYTGPHTGDGAHDTEWTAITERGGQPPKVRWASDKEITLGGLPAGAAIIGPITPEFSAGGTNLATLIGSDANTGDTFHVKITGPRHPDGAKYRLVKSTEEKALHYEIQVAPVDGK